MYDPWQNRWIPNLATPWCRQQRFPVGNRWHMSHHFKLVWDIAPLRRFCQKNRTYWYFVACTLMNDANGRSHTQECNMEYWGSGDILSFQFLENWIAYSSWKCVISVFFFDTFSGWVRGLKKLCHLHNVSTLKQHNFHLKEALRKRCTTYVDEKSSRKSKNDT